MTVRYSLLEGPCLLKVLSCARSDENVLFFVTKTLDELEHSEKRHPYYLRAANIYRICGRDDVQDVPCDVILAFGATFPEPGGNYKADRDTEKHSNRT